MEVYSVNLRIQSKYRKIRIRKNSAFGHFSGSVLFKPMDAQQIQDPEKVSTIWDKTLNKNVNKMKKTKSLTIRMKPKDVIKLDTVRLDRKYPEETVLPEDDLHRYLYQPGEQHENQKRQAADFIWSKNTYRLD